MGADLTLRWASKIATAEGDLGPRYVNKTGTPIKSIERRDLGEGSYGLAIYNGQLVADVYTLTFNVDGTTCYVNAALGDKNPWHAPAGVSITDDGSTEHDLVIPGLRLVFNTCTNTDEAVVSVGSYLSALAVSTAALNFGATKNDGIITSFRVGVKNIGDRDAVNIRVRPLPALYYTGTDAETIIARLGPHSNSSRDQMADVASLTMTFENWTDQGSYYSADVKVGGVIAIETAKFDGETIYEYGDGHGYHDVNDRFTGLQVVFAKITADPTRKTVTIQVRDGWEWARLAGDNDGSPGDFQNAELSLGELAVSGEVFLWMGMLIPEGQARGAIRIWTPRIIFEEV
jgi:hypothetical protein